MDKQLLHQEIQRDQRKIDEIESKYTVGINPQFSLQDLKRCNHIQGIINKVQLASM